MISYLRIFLVALAVTSSAFAKIGPNEAWNMPAVFEDFKNEFGDNTKQCTFAGARNTIEGKSGGGFWYTAKNSSSAIKNAAGENVASSTFTKGVDSVEHCLHVTMTTAEDMDYPYALVGAALTDDDKYHNVSTMTGLTVKAKGSLSGGTDDFPAKLSVYLVTKEYIDLPDDEQWGYFGVQLDLTATATATTFTNDEIIPGEGSVPLDGLEWGADGSKGLVKIQIQLEGQNATAEIWLYEISFAGMTYADCGFNKVPVVMNFTPQNTRNTFSVTPSHVSYTIAQPQNLSVNLFNASGLKVATLFSGRANAGNTMLPISTDRIAAGNYFVVMSGKSRTVSKPFTIVK